jgi:hypothetical protein
MTVIDQLTEHDRIELLAHAQGVTVDRGWKRRFDDPIPLPDGRQLVTLRDAGHYITKLPKADHEAAEWQAAHGGLDPGGDAGRADDVRAHRRHAGIEPSR